MNNLIQADIFFFISSIAVALLILVLLVTLYYVRQILANFRDISRTLKKTVDTSSENIENIFEDIEDSRIYTFLFGKKKKKQKQKQKKREE